MHFDDALRLVLHWEGGFSNNPRDSGGATNLGITQHALSDWYGRPATEDEVEALTVAEVTPIYKERYWDAGRCSELPHGIDLLVFDSAVNQGPGRARRFLQQALGVTSDSVLGPITMRAIAGCDREDLIDEIVARRSVHYASLKSEFHLGWFRRLSAMHRHALA